MGLFAKSTQAEAAYLETMRQYQEEYAARSEETRRQQEVYAARIEEMRKQQEEYAKRQEEYAKWVHRQEEERLRQQVEYDRHLVAQGELLRCASKQSAQVELLLSRWAELTERFAGVLSIWESQQSKKS